MDNITKRIAEFPTDYQALVTGEFPKQICVKLAVAFEFSASQAQKLHHAIVLTMLFYFNRSELVSYVEKTLQVSDDVALMVADGIIELLPEEFPRHLLNDDLHKGVSSSDTPNPEVGPAPGTLNTVRTMATDMQTNNATDPIHQSNQEAILNRTPFDEPRPSPRWGSESTD
jgi:hypothetical protein